MAQATDAKGESAMDETKVIAAVLAAGCASNHPGCLPERAIAYYKSVLEGLRKLEKEGAEAARPEARESGGE
jgi:hypothetical protein